MPFELAVLSSIAKCFVCALQIHFSILEKEFSEVLLDAPNVNPSFNAIITVGIAVSWKIWSKCPVKFFLKIFLDQASLFCRYWHPTAFIRPPTLKLCVSPLCASTLYFTEQVDDTVKRIYDTHSC